MVRNGSFIYVFFFTKIIFMANIVRKSLNKEKLLLEVVVAQAHCLGKIDYVQ